MSQFLHIEADEISAISKRGGVCNIKSLYEGQHNCEFFIITMGDGSYEFPAIGIFDEDTDEVKTLIQLDTDNVYHLTSTVAETSAVINDEISASLSDALPCGVS